MRCPRCFRELEMIYFKASHPWCVDCRRAYLKEWKKNNKDKIQAYQDKRREKSREYYKNWYKTYGRKRDPIKQKAHYLVQKAIKKGILKKPSHCKVCPINQKLEAHHEDYNQPLEVIWYCNKHHRAIHPGS